jgi:hypothetical protein
MDAWTKGKIPDEIEEKFDFIGDFSAFRFAVSSPAVVAGSVSSASWWASRFLRRPMAGGSQAAAVATGSRLRDDGCLLLDF